MKCFNIGLFEIVLSFNFPCSKFCTTREYIHIADDQLVFQKYVIHFTRSSMYNLVYKVHMSINSVCNQLLK